MTPTLIGYFPKLRTPRPDWLKAPQVEEIASVAPCIAKPPDGWIDKWRHNDLGIYDSPELAWSVVPAERRSEFQLYAYRMFPLQIDDTSEEPFSIPALSVEPLSSRFTHLGYDIVSRTGTTFACSPLSCNHMASQMTANKHCLLDDFGTALSVAKTFEGEQCEPGPYYIVEVWRENAI